MSAEQSSTWIVNTTDESFEVDVVQRSREVPVVVDFWADSCAPCRALGPVLESLAEQSNGEFVLAKADTATNQVAASQFQVSGIPAVFAVVDGEVVDSFQGALPEAAIREWLQGIAQHRELSQLRSVVSDSTADESSRQESEAILRGMLEKQPDDATANLLLAELLLQAGRIDECRSTIETLEARGFLEPEGERIKATLELAQKSDVDLVAARSEAEAAPNDFAKQFHLAEALVGQQEYVTAFEICLRLVRDDRQQTGEQARALMVDVFRVLPDGSELTSEYRRKLSMVLY